MTIFSYVVVGLLAVLGVSMLVEFYKKYIRKGESGVWENRIVAAVLSIGAAVLICLTGLAYLFFGNMIANIAVYSVAIFLLQLFVDMKIIKALLEAAIKFIDLEKFVDMVFTALGLTPEKVAKILANLGITEEKLKKALLDAGIPEDLTNKIIDVLFHRNK